MAPKKAKTKGKTKAKTKKAVAAAEPQPKKSKTSLGLSRRGGRGSIVGSEQHGFLRSMLNTMQGLPGALEKHVDERFERLEKRAAEREFKLDEARRAASAPMDVTKTPVPADTPMADASTPSTPSTPTSPTPPGRQPSADDTPMSPVPQSTDPLVTGNRMRLRYVPPTRIAVRTHTHELIPVAAPRPLVRNVSTSYLPNVSGIRRTRTDEEVNVYPIRAEGRISRTPSTSER